MSEPNDHARRIADRLLHDLRAALDSADMDTQPEWARLDVHRQERTGTPEIILAEHKTYDQVIELVSIMLERSGSVLISRAPEPILTEVKETFSHYVIEHPERSSMVRVAQSEVNRSNLRGKVAIFTAGTSDVPSAHEVRLVAEEMGTNARVWADLGVAGLHRLIQPFREAIEWGTSSIVVVAGMDGALPSVISGLSPVPVIGLPVSVGYGFGGQGEGALMAMLQTCAPGLTVVNIDNSVGAGIAAARIARQSSFTG